MKEKKKTSNQIEQERKIQLLKNHFPVDEQKQVVYINLHFDKAEDILVPSMSSQDKPWISNDLLNLVADALDELPHGYKAGIDLEIQDFQGYKADTLLEEFNNRLESSQYQYQKEKRRKWVSASLMVVFGIWILLIMLDGNAHGWFGQSGSEQASLISEILDICGWVFIWEAVSVIFLSPSETHMRSQKIRVRVSTISISDQKTKKILAKENKEQIYQKWSNSSFLYRLGMRMLLVSSAAFLALSFNVILHMAVTLKEGNATDYSNITFYVTTIVSGILLTSFYFWTGTSGYRFYTGHGRIMAFVTSLILLVFVLLEFIDSIVQGRFDTIVTGTFGFLMDIIFILGYLFSGGVRKDPNLKKEIKTEFIETKNISDDFKVDR